MELGWTWLNRDKQASSRGRQLGSTRVCPKPTTFYLSSPAVLTLSLHQYRSQVQCLTHTRCLIHLNK